MPVSYTHLDVYKRQPIAKVLHDAGIFVSIVNALLIYKYGNNSIRKGKTDKLDAVKIANYCLDRWTVLERYTPVDQIRQALKTCRRQYDQYIRLKVNLKNNLITLLDGTFPGLNILFKSAPRNMDGHEKWVDFAGKFWHRECICGNSEKAFTNQYKKWCAKAGYRFREEKASSIYAHAVSQVNTLPMTDSIKRLVTLAVSQLNTIIETISVIRHEMLTLAAQDVYKRQAYCFKASSDSAAYFSSCFVRRFKFSSIAATLFLTSAIPVSSLQSNELRSIVFSDFSSSKPSVSSAICFAKSL